jgi:Spy/CpxP family protein refolding chaperone
MTRCFRGTALSLVAVSIVLAISQAAEAQREEGRRGRGGPEGRRFGGGFGALTLRLATNDKVQEALKLSDEQKGKIEELDEKFRDDRRKLLDDSGGQEGMQKLSEEAAASLAEVLDDEQQKRLQGISIQLMGAGAVLADPALAKELNVTDEQKSKLREAQQSNWRARGESFRELRDLSEEERRAKEEKLRAEADKRLLEVLEPEQQEKLNALRGDKVDITMADVFGRGRGGFEGRGGRDRGERGDRPRGDRDRDRDDSDSDSDKSA